MKVLNIIKGDILKIKPIPYNKKPYSLFLMDKKSRFRWVILMFNKKGSTVFKAIKTFFKGLKNQYGRYLLKLYFDGGKEMNNLLQNWLAFKSILFTTFSPYIHK